MKTRFLFAASVLCSLAFCAQGMIENQIRVGGVNVTFTGFNEAQTDATPDASTAGFTMTDNPLGKYWEWSVFNLQTGSKNLTAGLDVTLGTDIEVQFQKFPNGHQQGVRWIYIQGADLRDFVYSDVTDTIDMKIRPTVPARTVGHPTAHTAGLGIRFYYGGVTTAPIDYSPPVILGNVFLSDLVKPQHPSSDLLWGRAIRLDGIQGEQVRADFLFGSSYADRWNIDLDDFRGYLDGEVPASGFSATLPATPSFSVNMGISGEEFRIMTILNHNFSAHDIQAGVFRAAPQFTGVQRETTGVRVFWNADTNRTYRLESFAILGGTTNIVATNLPGPNYLDTTIGANPARFYRLREE